MKTTWKTRPIAALMLSTSLASTAAHGQSMDYGSLEMLFGEPVTTSATGKPQRATEAPVTMEIVTAEEIRRTGATNVPDAIRFVNGIDIIQFSSTDNEVTVRGLNGGYSPNLLVLINGRQVYMDHYGITAWSALPVTMDEIRQIEIVKGPNTALFGFNAVAGVINIVTINPMYDEAKKITIRAGSQQAKEISALASFKVGEKIGIRISGEASEQNAFETDLAPAVGSLALNDPSRQAALVDAIYQVTKNTQISLEGSYARIDRMESRGSLNIGNSGYQTHSVRGNINSSTDFGLVKASIYSNWLDADYGNGTLLENQVTVAQIEDLFKVGTQHSFRISGEFRRNVMDSSFNIFAVPSQVSTISYDVFSIGGMWNWAVNDKLTLTNSLRLDHMIVEKEGYIPSPPPTAVGPSPVDTLTNADWDRKIDEYSVNSGLVYQISNYDTLRVSYGRGVRVPNLLSFNLFTGFSPFPGVNVELIGNPNVEPTIVQNYELGYDRKVEQTGGTFRASVFYQQQEDVTGTDMTTTPVLLLPGPPPVFGATLYSQFTNVGDSALYGAEVSLDGQTGKFKWDVGYTYASIDDELDPSAAATTFETRTPEHRVVGHVGYTHDGWEFDLYGQYVSEYSTGPMAIEAFTRIDARLAKVINDSVTASVTATNFNGKHFEGAGQELEPKVLLQITTTF
jgi:iron complex outermembrane recepter protein